MPDYNEGAETQSDGPQGFPLVVAAAPVRVHGPSTGLSARERLAPQLAQEEKLERLYRDIELPVAEVLYRMERNGVLIDVFALAQQSDELGRRLMELEREAHMLAGQPFNLASPKQLAEILFEKQGLPVVKKTPSGGPSTDEEVLTQLALDYPLPKLLLEHRSFAKLKGTYTDKLPRMVNATTGRVHTSFSQAVAVTGRLASTDPNLQNIPTLEFTGLRGFSRRSGGTNIKKTSPSRCSRSAGIKVPRLNCDTQSKSQWRSHHRYYDRSTKTATLFLIWPSITFAFRGRRKRSAGRTG